MPCAVCGDRGWLCEAHYCSRPPNGRIMSKGHWGLKRSAASFVCHFGGVVMRKIVLVFAMAFSVSAYGAMLTKEVIEGTKKICIYSDGSTITISATGLCPLTK